MVTYTKMIMATPHNIMSNAANVRVKFDGKMVNEDKIGKFIEYSYQAADLDGPRQLTIRVYVGTHYMSWVHCDCPWFQYNCEVALTLKGSSEIRTSNGKSPQQNNPKMLPMICKHTVACFHNIMRRDRNLLV